MDGEIIKFLRNCKLFASLDANDDVFKALSAQFEQVRIEEGHYLFHQGDNPDYLYLLATGRLAATFTAPGAKTKTIGYVQPGETIGEMGALSGSSRTLNVKAVEDSLVLRLGIETFKKLCRQYPAVLFETISPLVSRSSEIIRALSTDERKKHIAIMPANTEINLEKFEELIKETLRHYKKVILLSETEINSDSTKTTVNVSKIISEAEENNHIILYLLKPYETPLSQECWNKISKIYIVGEGNTPPNISIFVLEKLRSTRHLVETRRELILLYKKSIAPKNTQEWLDQASFFLHHHIQAHDKADYQRLLRFMRGKNIGVVLSGGGARGWGHLGALKALLEANIPIDAIGGTSAGAIIGGLYARNKNLDAIHERFGLLLDTTRNVVSLKNFCWPAISLFNCRDFTLETQDLFRSLQIENLSIPYFCITCNLTHYKEVVHRSGLLWEKIRASTAVPGLVPPMVIEGDLHIDGGVINNLPVNIMREMLGTDSKIIAVELISHHNDIKKYNFPPTLTFKEAFFAKLRLGYRDYSFPPFLDTFIKSLLVGSSVNQHANALTADLLIKPDTAKYSMLRVSKKQRDELIRLGYETTVERLKNWDPRK